MKLGHALAVLVLFLVAQPLSAQTWEVYDNFKGPLINPALWIPNGGACQNALDCERQVQHGQLRLRIRGYGLTNTDAGQNWSQNSLEATQPTGIIGIGAKLTVTRAISNSCPSTQSLAGQMGLRATFFNSGTGAQTDDIEANLHMYPHGTDSSIDVGGLIKNGSGNLDGVSLGSVDIGETVTIWVRWDKANQKVVYGLQHPGQPPIEQEIQYAMSDTSPVFYPYRLVQLQTSPKNCTSDLVYSDIEVKITQVTVLR